MDKIFIDCNILLDWLMDREPFSIYASKIVTLIEEKKIKGYISPLILSNIYYILVKNFNKKLAFEFIKDCEAIFTVLDITNKIVKESIKNKYKDLEDDLHYFTAKIHNIPNIITRDKKDYIKEKIKIYTAEEYLK